jgi:hypothetical protein
MEAKAGLRQILYVSAGRPDLGPDGLSEILRTARRNNADWGLTGLLCHLDGSFLQILEGEADAVGRMYRRIHRDPRHDRMMILLDRPIAARDFPDWRMGFEDLSPESEGGAEAFRLTEQALLDALPAEGAGSLLTMARTFYRINRPHG